MRCYQADDTRSVNAATLRGTGGVNLSLDTKGPHREVGYRWARPRQNVLRLGEILRQNVAVPVHYRPFDRSRICSHETSQRGSLHIIQVSGAPKGSFRRSRTLKPLCS